MGFFSGIVGGLLGGGGSNTSVSQEAANTTEVTVTNEISNVIDTTVFAEVLAAVGTAFNDTVNLAGEKTRALLSKMDATDKATVIAKIGEVQVENDRNAIFSRAVDLLKYAALAVGVIFIGKKIL